MSRLRIRQAYDKGWASQGTNVDWDVAVDRFAAKYARRVRDLYMPMTRDDRPDYELLVAWMDAWSDRSQGHLKGHALRCPKGLTLGYNGNHDGHDMCDLRPEAPAEDIREKGNH